MLAKCPFQGVDSHSPDPLGERGLRREHLSRVIAPGLMCSSVGTPASMRRWANAMSSSRNRSTVPTSMNVGGQAGQSSQRDGAAYWSGLPSPRYHFQASMLPSRSHSPMSVISWLDGGLVPVVDHRVDRHLEADGRAAAVAGQQHGGDGQSAAGAAAVDGQPVRVDAAARRRGRPSRPVRRSSPRPAPGGGSRGPAGTPLRPPRRRRDRRSRWRPSPLRPRCPGSSRRRGCSRSRAARRWRPPAGRSAP